jgi:hypothetical protein
VPVGVEKSTEQVECQLGIPPGGPHKCKFISQGHPDHYATPTSAGGLPYGPATSGTASVEPTATAPISNVQPLPELAPAPVATMPEAAALDVMIAEVEAVATEVTKAESSVPMVIDPVEGESATPEGLEDMATMAMGEIEPVPVAVMDALATVTMSVEGSVPQVPDVAAGAPSAQDRVYMPYIKSLLNSDREIPESILDIYENHTAANMRASLVKIGKRISAVLGFKGEEGPMYPRAAYRLESLLQMLRAAPDKIKQRRHFVKVAMALLVS